jgi:hypothetical protein
MGLLDEAIREHLELKRRRGADPSAIAREEHEALADEDVIPGNRGGIPPDEIDIEPGPVAMYDDEGLGKHAPDAKDLALAAQETAELDMRAVIGDPNGPLGAAPVGPISESDATGTDPLVAAADDGFDWKTPGEHGDGPKQAEIPGQKRMTFE